MEVNTQVSSGIYTTHQSTATASKRDAFFMQSRAEDDTGTQQNYYNSTVSETYRKRRYDFNYSNFGTPDGKAAERIVDRIIYNK